MTRPTTSSRVQATGHAAPAFGPQQTQAVSR
ncbi:hypothetical protein FraEuI1c_4993 [Pseudofrankia inefficax]|uniref:Uncharacterized protein n=1 Tax=Pseudofrankia inefficax (strain DSM 45817 / CECT 9037 / DDB 130130 / EuI1c) TaxID=298654 RepID=E3J332_PSEI1|nr:hypothetical protein FraEuI1c_4993 [Pseudofrankia inefficax]